MDAGILEQENQQSLLKNTANLGSNTGSNVAKEPHSESADVDVEGEADAKIEEAM